MELSNANDLKVEQIVAQYFNDEVLRVQPVPVTRIDSGYLRTYYTNEKRKGDKGPVIRTYIGVTSLIQAVTPTSPHLIKWMVDNGKEAEHIKEERKHYGTLMHILFEQMLHALINKSTFDFDEIPAETLAYIEVNALHMVSPEKWICDLRQDCLGFAKFLTEYKVRPVAIEIALKCDKYRTCGTLDLVCYMTVEETGYFGEVYKADGKGGKKGDPKLTKGEVEYLAIVDFKSSRKGVHLEHEIQLAYYDEAWEENFPDFKGKKRKLFNYRPTDWRTKPNYALCDQTDKHSEKYLKLLSDTYYIDDKVLERNHLIIGGQIDFSSPEIEKNYLVLTTEELIKMKEGL